MVSSGSWPLGACAVDLFYCVAQSPQCLPKSGCSMMDWGIHEYGPFIVVADHTQHL